MLISDSEALTLSKEFSSSVAAWKSANFVDTRVNAVLLPHNPSTRILHGAVAAAMVSANALLFYISFASKLAA